MREIDIRNMNTTNLAYIGDAVYEVYVRKYIIENYKGDINQLNRRAIKYVRAESQAIVLKKIMSQLSEEEQAVVRRGKNKKITSKPQKADPKVYKLATGFEALIGYLDLLEKENLVDNTRKEEIVNMSIDIINGLKDEEVKR